MSGGGISDYNDIDKDLVVINSSPDLFPYLVVAKAPLFPNLVVEKALLPNLVV